MAADPLLRDCLGAALDAQDDLAVAGSASSLTRWPLGVARDDVTAVVADLGPGAELVPVVMHVLRDATAGMPLVLLLDDPAVGPSSIPTWWGTAACLSSGTARLRS